MSEIQTFYPTSGMSDRSFDSIMTAFYNCLNGIAEVTDFFDSAGKIGDETKTSYSDFKIEFKKRNSILRVLFGGNYGSLAIANNGTTYSSNGTNRIAGTMTNAISVSFITGKNETSVLWLDDLIKSLCIVWNKFGDKYFPANSSTGNSYSFYYSDTGGNVNNLTNPFN